ncbi:hypothetical protein ETB97_009747, partial [Aspergillus alliaceus]
MPEKKRTISTYQPSVGKRQRRSPVSSETANEEASSDEVEQISPESITIAIFCALVYEAVAVRYTLDEEYSCRPKGIGPKKYVYSFGRIAEHKVVIARPYQMGTIEAAHCATAVSQQFPNVRLALMVGIGAGIPNLPKHDIRLGDLAISIPQDGHPGVIQYDFVKYEQGGVAQKGYLNKPPPILISADGSLQEDELMEKHPLKKILRKITKIPKFARPRTDDILFDINFHHINEGSDCSECVASSERRILLRSPRSDHQPIIHRGLILSGNGVVKNPQGRDELRRGYSNAVCFEMEAAGIMDEIPCLVVRGICDYADTHKQDSWHYYAAAVAAAYCRALLCKVDSQEVEETRSMREVIKDMKGLIAESVVDNIDQNIIFKKLHPIKEASFDSYMEDDEGQCLSGTRTEILAQVSQWGLSLSSPYIFWLNGMAGTGKSTISRTLGALFKGKKILGASFFFKRGEGNRGSAKRLFATIAWQLLAKFPELAASIKTALNNDPDITVKSLKEQFDKLVLNPLRDLEEKGQRDERIVLIIDALDECESPKDIGSIIQLLPRLKQLEAIQIRIFLTSRPELPTVLGFREVEETDRQDLILHEIPEPIIAHDIALFLTHRFLEIRKKHLLPNSWPRDQDIQKLAKTAVPLFILAATVCRFIEDMKWSPQERLSEFLRDPATKSASLMDRTYLPILTQLLTGQNDNESQQLKQEFHGILGVIIVLASPLSVNALANLIGKPIFLIQRRVEVFRSVLNVPSDLDMPVRLLHLSFRDFLISTDGDLHIDEKDTHAKIALHCLRVMENQLIHNICGLASYGTERKDIDPPVIKQHLTAELQYSSRYWVYHLEQSEGHISEFEILSFLKRHFLHWLEALTLIESISDAVEMIDTLKSSTW